MKRNLVIFFIICIILNLSFANAVDQNGGYVGPPPGFYDDINPETFCVLNNPCPYSIIDIPYVFPLIAFLTIVSNRFKLSFLLKCITSLLDIRMYNPLYDYEVL